MTLLSLRFQTELGYDFLEIHDGPNLLSPLVGSFNGTQVPQFLFSSSNFLYLLFTTDNSRSNAGFKLLYESKSADKKTACLCIQIRDTLLIGTVNALTMHIPMSISPSTVVYVCVFTSPCLYSCIVHICIYLSIFLYTLY